MGHATAWPYFCTQKIKEEYLMKYTIGLSGKANAAQAERLAKGYCYFHIKKGNRIVAQVEAVLDDLVACYDVDGKDLEFVLSSLHRMGFSGLSSVESEHRLGPCYCQTEFVCGVQL